MSDERDGAGSAGDSIDTPGPDTGRPTTVATQPTRPTGKRSRRAVVSDADDDTSTDTENGTATKTAVSKNGAGTATKTAKKSADRPSRNPIAFVWNYLKQVVAELRKVIWPNRKQMISYTTVVLIFLAFMVALIGLVDLGLVKLVTMVFG